MSLTVHSSAVYDALMQTFDTIELEPDPANRLALLLQLKREFETRIFETRNKAAYEARQKYAISDIAAITGAATDEVYYWASRWQKATGSPRLKRRERIDISGALDATGFIRSRALLGDTGHPTQTG